MENNNPQTGGGMHPDQAAASLAFATMISNHLFKNGMKGPEAKPQDAPVPAQAQQFGQPAQANQAAAEPPKRSRPSPAEMVRSIFARKRKIK